MLYQEAYTVVIPLISVMTIHFTSTVVTVTVDYPYDLTKANKVDELENNDNKWHTWELCGRFHFLIWRPGDTVEDLESGVSSVAWMYLGELTGLRL